MTPEQERAGYQASIDTIQRVTGTRPIGFNAFWLRGTPNTLGILHDLGFIYHIDGGLRQHIYVMRDGFVVYGNDHRGHGLTARPSKSFGEFGPGGFDQPIEAPTRRLSDYDHGQIAARQKNDTWPRNVGLAGCSFFAMALRETMFVCVSGVRL
jgi:hypothetical protein